MSTSSISGPVPLATETTQLSGLSSGKRARETSKTETENPPEKKQKVLTPYDHFWILLKHLMTPFVKASPELQDLAQVVCITFSLGTDNHDAGIEKLKSLSNEQIKELLSLTEWAYLLEIGRIPLDRNPKRDTSMRT